MLSNDDIRQILDADSRSPNVSMLNPLNVSVSSPELVRVLELVLAQATKGPNAGGLIVTAAERQRCLVAFPVKRTV